MKELTQSVAFYLANRAHTEKELKFLLTPYISTRLYVCFNHQDKNKRKKTFYANEHRVTYSQCLRGFTPNIVLNKLAGYNALVNMIEQDLRGKYIGAKLFYRPPGFSEFDFLLREYNKRGELVPRMEIPGQMLYPDPPFDESECQVLYYSISNGRVVVHTTQPTEVEIDFKKEINDRLSKRHH